MKEDKSVPEFLLRVACPHAENRGLRAEEEIAPERQTREAGPQILAVRAERFCFCEAGRRYCLSTQASTASPTGKVPPRT